jgi:cytoskeletal protein CcmA (bactofilin family)
MMNKRKFRKNGVSSSKVDTLIGQGTRVVGNVHFSGSLHVDGLLKGDASCDANEESLMMVSESGTIEGETRVPNLVVDGTIRGNVFVSNHLVLGEHARVEGNVQYRTIEMVVGAEVNGSMSPCSKVEHAKLAKPRMEVKPKLSVDTNTRNAEAASLKTPKSAPVS